MRIETTLRVLARAYGVLLDGMEETGNAAVSLWKDEDGWHISSSDCWWLTDEAWAPQSDEQAQEVLQEALQDQR